MGLPRVFFDVAADGSTLGRIVIEVSSNVFFIIRPAWLGPATLFLEIILVMRIVQIVFL